MSRRLIAFLVLAASACACALVAWQNTAAIELKLAGVPLVTTTGIEFALAWLLGTVGAGALFASSVSDKKAQDATLANWQTQDAKLAGQVQSDREKQLEAKIKTLEVALDKALQKK